MSTSDVLVTGSQVTFRDVRLDPPLHLSGAAIHSYTLPLVRVDVVDRAGRQAVGFGAGALSIPWAWPRSRIAYETRDRILRDLVTRLARRATEVEPADPFRIWRELDAIVPDEAAQASDALGGHGGTSTAGRSEPVPPLASMLALAPIDAAIHDAWGRAGGAPAWDRYDAAHLTDDLAAWFGADFAGRYPTDFLTPARTALAVQHVVGTADPLTDAEAASSGEVSLESWLRRDRTRHVKIKVSGMDPSADAARVDAVQRLLTHVHGSHTSLSLDPNEAYLDPVGAAELLDRLRRDAPAAWTSLAYLEQPIAREHREADVSSLAARRPVVADEGYTRLDDLPELVAAGWNGIAVKSAKGHSLSLLTACWARRHGLYLTVQDLTTVDLALVHSARLASRLPCSHPAFEYNSRQYAPDANRRLAARDPDLVAVRDGTIRLDPTPTPGLYRS